MGVKNVYRYGLNCCKFCGYVINILLIIVFFSSPSYSVTTSSEYPTLDEQCNAKVDDSWFHSLVSIRDVSSIGFRAYVNCAYLYSSADVRYSRVLVFVPLSSYDGDKCSTATLPQNILDRVNNCEQVPEPVDCSIEPSHTDCHDCDEQLEFDNGFKYGPLLEYYSIDSEHLCLESCQYKIVDVHSRPDLWSGCVGHNDCIVNIPQEYYFTITGEYCSSSSTTGSGGSNASIPDVGDSGGDSGGGSGGDSAGGSGGDSAGGSGGDSAGDSAGDSVGTESVTNDNGDLIVNAITEQTLAFDTVINDVTGQIEDRVIENGIQYKLFAGKQLVGIEMTNNLLTGIKNDISNGINVEDSTLNNSVTNLTNVSTTSMEYLYDIRETLSRSLTRVNNIDNVNDFAGYFEYADANAASFNQANATMTDSEIQEQFHRTTDLGIADMNVDDSGLGFSRSCPMNLKINSSMDISYGSINNAESCETLDVLVSWFSALYVVIGGLTFMSVIARS